jgi:hypothetical protein
VIRKKTETEKLWRSPAAAQKVTPGVPVDKIYKQKQNTNGKFIMKIKPGIWLVMSIVAFLGGMTAFIVLFVLDFNIYWLILAPVILAIYQSPAAYFFWLYKKTRQAESESGKKSAPDGI